MSVFCQASLQCRYWCSLAGKSFTTDVHIQFSFCRSVVQVKHCQYSVLASILFNRVPVSVNFEQCKVVGISVLLRVGL